MPRGNGTGPEGRGPMTGRRAGYCAGTGMPGYAGGGAGRGRGFGRGHGFGAGRGFGPGRGMGWGAGAAPAIPAEAEKWNLERRAEALEEELRAVRGRLEALEAQA